MMFLSKLSSVFKKDKYLKISKRRDGRKRSNIFFASLFSPKALVNFGCIGTILSSVSNHISNLALSPIFLLADFRIGVFKYNLHWPLSAGIDFSNTGLTYDANGNILTMLQKGLKLNSSPTIDQLTYTYQLKSNKLAKVADAIVTNDNGKLGDFKDGANGVADDYAYDVNGNLTLDNNKAISSITYNHLNLPAVITTPKGTITYSYDAAGSKLKKVTQENGATVLYSDGNNYVTNITTTTNYIATSGLVYESKSYSNASLSAWNYPDRLQFAGHEEGRIRFKLADGSFNFDYFLKDHLGNTRMVLTEEQQTDMYPAATMETASSTTEQTYYSNLSATRTDISTIPGYPANSPAGSTQVAKVNGAGNKIGPAIVLKVMAGDKFNLSVNSWWSSAGSSFPVNSIATDLANALATGLAGVSAGKASAVDLISTGLTPTDATDFLATQANITTKPKAYINWILLDEQFKVARDASGTIIGSGSEQVVASGVFNTHTRTSLPVNKNGYLYIYVSNESNNINVFFDNLQVTHIRGPILEETHYYPFGLTMAGISSQALKNNYANNKNKFQGQELQNKEFSDGSGLEMYEFKYRMDDPQTGRFWSIDPLADKYVYNSTYAFSENKVTRHVELEGLESVDGIALFTSIYCALQGEANNAVGANYRIATGQSGGSNSHAPASYRSTQSFTNKLVDHVDASKPTITVLDISATSASLLPFGEAGVAPEVLPFLYRGSEEIAGNTTLKLDVGAGSDVGNEIGILRDAAKGKGDFSLGTANAETSNKLGAAWTGDGAKVASDGKILVSENKLRQYRPPTAKKTSFSTTGFQSNFEERNKPFGEWQSNGHLNITPITTTPKL